MQRPIPPNRVALDDRGATLVETVLVVALVALVALAAFAVMGSTSRQRVDCAARAIDGAAPAAPCGSGGSSAVSALGSESVARSRSSLASEREVRVMAGAPPLAPGAWSPLAPARRIAFVPGDADVDGVDPNDVRQGHIGDCYLMAALMSVAAMHPEMIHDIVEPRGDGSWLVTLHDEVEAEPLSLIVRPEFPGRPWWGVFVGMSSSSAGVGDVADGKQELWPQLIEKAYAKAAGGYDAIGNGGSPAAALAAITGMPVRPTYDCCRPVDRFDLDELASALDAGQPIVASSIDTSSLEDADDATRALFQRDGWAKYVIGNAFHEGQLVTNHAYSVVAADPVRGTVTVQNPWGWEDEGLTLTLEEFQNAFWVYDTALTPPR